ncbi:MAG TPA: nuclear transport factor 2 family protein [Terracidiphilus sp.]|nr:nuclear transport factor 2 family protein [Terracidiphilus sp.]
MTGAGEIEMLHVMYRNFNARRIDDVLAHMTDGVEWPNRIDGGYLHGKDAVRAYWQRQFATIDPHVEPRNIGRDAQGRFEVGVHQTVRDLEGKLLLDAEVKHLYTIRNGLIERMDVED